MPELRPYQVEGAAFLASRRSALLADEMGLGKTVQASQALRAVLGEARERRALLVVPASLVGNWERELARWCPELVVRRLQGSAGDRRFTYQLPIQLLITSYEQARQDSQVLMQGPTFDIVVLDEVQRIKNRNSAVHLATSLIPRERAWALSGTPLENSPADLVSVFDFIAPGLLRDWMPRNAMHDLMRDLFLRRRKSEVLGDLPPIIWQDIDVELTPEQRDSYDELWRAGRSRIELHGREATSSMLALITRLKQICNFDPHTGASAKWDLLQDVVEDVTANGEKLLVFSQYVETLSEISSRLADVPHDVFHGGLDLATRDEVVARFETAPGPRILLVSLRAGGTGLNLQAASTVVLFDRWWNPAVEAQAVQRAHRFGREAPLHVVALRVKETIEERIAELLAIKQELFDLFVEEAPRARPEQQAGDLRRLLEL